MTGTPPRHHQDLQIVSTLYVSSIISFICAGHAQVRAIERVLVLNHGDPVFASGDLSNVCKRDHTPLHKAFIHRRLCTIFRVLVQSCPLFIVDLDTPINDLRQCVVLCTSASICLVGVALVCSKLELQGATVALPFGLMTPAGGSMYVSFPGGLMLLECSMSEVMSNAGFKEGKIGFVKDFRVKSAEEIRGAPSSL